MKNINLKTIRIDGDTQSRVRLDESAVADYTQVLKDGGELPPVVVFFDGSENWLADGFHRYHAYSGDKRASIPADVRSGTRRDAMLFSFGANGAHGLRRTNDDKRKAVSAMLADAEWLKWSDGAIAKACHVTQPFVSSVRKSLETVMSEPTPTKRFYTTKHGTQTTMQTAAIGKTERETPAADEFGPDAEELAADAAGEQADRQAVALILENDEPLAAAIAENKRLTLALAKLQQRLDGLINEKNEAIKLANTWRRKFEKSQKVAA